MIWILCGLVAAAGIVAIFGVPPFMGGPSKNELFATDRSSFEAGARRLPNGMIEVAAYTRMPNVTAEMVDWWFADYLQTTEHYKMWEPDAHVWMEWENKQSGTVIGASHLVHEYVGGELQKLRIQFVDPKEVFGTAPELTGGDVAICAWPGLLDEPLFIGKMCHFIHNTEFGCEMRSRFWLGDVAGRSDNERVWSIKGLIGNTYLMRRLLVNKSGGTDLMTHAMSEMGNLADFLPDLYAKRHEVAATPETN